LHEDLAAAGTNRHESCGDSGEKRTGSMKFGMTTISFFGWKTSSVTCFRCSETAVTASDFLDPEARDREVRPVLPDDRGRPSVERRDEGEAHGREHLARKVCRDRVRKRVVTWIRSSLLVRPTSPMRVASARSYGAY